MIKKDQVKKIEKGDTITRLWYTLKSLDPCMNQKYKLKMYTSCKTKKYIIESGKSMFSIANLKRQNRSF